MVEKHNVSSLHLPVLDFYLFFNPVDPICYSCIDELIRSTELLKNKTYLHVIPYQNFQLINQYMKENLLPLNDLTLRNRIQDTSYTIATTFKAAHFQGKKKAHLFLQQLNQFTQQYHHDVTNDMILCAAKQAELDIDMLLEDRESENVKTLYQHAQQVASQLDVQVTPSIVVFDTLQSCGVLLEKDISLDNILCALRSQHNIAKLKEV